MKLLLLYKTTPESLTFKTPTSFGVQGEVLARGLRDLGVPCKIVDRRNGEEKAAAYQDFKPDFVIGIGYWGDVPEIVLHPLSHNQTPVPWLVADGAVLKYQTDLNQLKLVLATSSWTKEVLERDGVTAPAIKVVYEGVDTSVFKPISRADPSVKKFRERFKVGEDQILILTVGGDAKSKGFQEVIAALKQLGDKFKNWRYVVKVAASPTGEKQTREDLALVNELGLQEQVIFFSEMLAKSDQAALFNAADIYAAPSHNEGFGRPLVEAQACGVPALTVAGTAAREIIRHDETGFAAKVGEEIFKQKFTLEGKEIELEKPKLIGVKADPADLATYLLKLADPNLRREMGEAGRKFVLENFDYRKTAKDMVEAIRETFSVG
jgi:glycosyltransferase involved in cell wall biosynthesis